MKKIRLLDKKDILNAEKQALHAVYRAQIDSYLDPDYNPLECNEIIKVMIKALESQLLD